MSYARVLIDRTKGTQLDYAIPQELAHRIAIGSRVRVALRGKEVMGMVLSLHSVCAFSEVKPLLAVIDHTIQAEEKRPLLSPLLMKLAHWIADYYCTSLDTVLRSILPPTIRNDSLAAKKTRLVSLLKKPTATVLEALEKKAPKQKALLEELLLAQEKKELSWLLKKTKASTNSVQGLVNAGWISLEEQLIERDLFAGEELLPSPIPKLNRDQEHVVQILCEALKNLSSIPTNNSNSFNATRPFLLHGVTGSGKTEVYLRAMEQALNLGKSVLVLVPEIALTPQTVERFRGRLESTHGKKLIAVLHSHLSQGERHDEWLRLYRGEARVVIGARSAIFAPLQNLGLIVVDEEHETSYKQEEAPRYHARDVAVMRAHYERCVILLGSATPSLESYHNTLLKKYHLLELPERADQQKMPLVRVLDLRLQGKQKGADSILSFPLRKAIKSRLERGEQIILFLNRRGFSSALLCPSCGKMSACPHCSLSLTFHRVTEKLICHLCGHVEKPPKACPQCRSTEILYSGVGTQRVEAAVQQAFPQARSFRIDADTMRHKKSYQETFQQFRARQIDILIGTQMIAKGLDFPNVTLVGIINADTSLHAPDFRAGERTFQLLTQVAGRAGRGDREGEVMIQTFTPASPSIQFARHHDYQGFFEQESEFRKQFGYPPFQRMMLIQVRGIVQEAVALHAEDLARACRQQADAAIYLGEAVPAPLEKTHGQYRFHLTLRSASTKAMQNLVRSVLQTLPTPKGVIVTVDVDPQSLF